MKSRRSAILLATSAIIGFVFFVVLTPEYSILFSINSKLDRGQAINKSERIARVLGISLPSNLMENTTFHSDGVSLAYSGEKVGTRMTNILVREDSIPLNYWEVVWFDPSKQATEGTTLEVTFSEGGRLFGYRLNVSDTAAGPFLNKKEALANFHDCWDSLGFAGLTDVSLSSWKLNSSEPVVLEHRQDWMLTFVRDTGQIPGLKEDLKVRIEGDRITSLNIGFSPPGQFTLSYAAKTYPFVFLTIISWVMMFVLFAVGLVIFLRRYNEGEAGIGSSMSVSIAYYVLAAISFLLSFSSVAYGLGIGTMNILYESLIAIGVVVLLWLPLVAILTFSSWGIGESSARAIWPDKLYSFDAASHLKFLNEKLGKSTLRGYAYAGIILGVYSILHPVFHLHSYASGFIGSGTALDSYIPALKVLADALAIALFGETFSRLGILSFFGRKKIVKGVTVSLLIFFPLLFYPMPFGEYSVLIRIVFIFMLSAALIFLFLRYDFVTAVVTSAIFCSAQGLIPIFASSNSYFQINAVIASVLLALPIVVSFIGFWKKQPFELTVDLMPAHIRRISERERMTRELEIAKSVQNNLFPKVTPKVPQLEFGGICIPALEVGGDYYDFVQMESGLTGTAIADVSGKGLPAAIYMTLTKGALQASAENQSSPKNVLSKINQIVYRSISRGTFISMIYAVIDEKTRRVKFSRAGHNPLALFSSGNKSAQLFTPSGLALGLDSGEKFDSTLEEMEITLRPGDALVFYTDGFTEAMDSQANEFGEERLVSLVESVRHLPVKEMLTRIDAGVRKFVGNAPQHDDMTMVVIKVKQE